MATTRKLQMNFSKSNGSAMSISYGNVKASVNNADVKSLMEGIVANGEIFRNTPVSMNSAQLITTEKQDIDLS